MSTSRVRGAVLGQFLGDATSLGYHWIYDTTTIPQPLPSLALEAPRAQWHNKNLKPGSFTHYGDQTLVLLQSLEKDAAFHYDLERFWSLWKAFWAPENPANAYTYRDGATKSTLANLKTKGDSPRTAGSDSHDFSAVGRIAPLLLAFQSEVVQDGNTKNYLQAVREVVGSTHNSKLVVDSAEFFAKVLALLVRTDGGAAVSPTEAIRRTLSDDSINPDVKEKVQKGLDSVGQETTAAIKAFGPACSTEGALPSTVHLIAKYESDFSEALKRNISAGGDSAARGGVVGAILGAHVGFEALPESLLKQLQSYPTLAKLLSL